MSNVLIRDVPDPVHEGLRRRARAQGKSLQQYLLEELTKLNERPSMNEWLDRLSELHGGKFGFGDAVEALEAERGRR